MCIGPALEAITTRGPAGPLPTSKEIGPPPGPARSTLPTGIEGSSTSAPGSRSVIVEILVACAGALTALAALDVSTRTLCSCKTRGFIRGAVSEILGARSERISGCSNGKTTSVVAIAACNANEITAGQRLRPRKRELDSTRDSWNMTAPRTSSICRIQRWSAYALLDTAHAHTVPHTSEKSLGVKSSAMATTLPANAPAPELTERTITGPPRVLSVDILRGLTIAFMILVNDPGDWDHVFAPLDHAPWNGWTLTDLVFPTFLFLVGASIIFSLDARAAKGNCRKTLSGHVILRCCKILLLQYILVFFPYMHWHTMRLYGVLPRIALCYLLAGLILIATSKLKFRVPVLIGIVATLLIGYWALLRFVPVPGVGLPVRDIPFMDQTQNLTSWLDRAAMAFTQHWFHTGRLYLATRDPEGLLSTLPAVATTLLGSLTGLWMRQTHGPRGSSALRRMQLTLAATGILGVLAGALWSPYFPINKNLWTSSYVLLAAGWAALALALLSLLVDRRPEPWPRWLQISTWPWFVFGSNAIAAFTVSVLVVKTGLYFKHTNSVTGIKTSLWGLYYQHLFARHASTNWTSLAFALSIVLICFLPNLFLWRRKIFLKI